MEGQHHGNADALSMIPCGYCQKKNYDSPCVRQISLEQPQIPPSKEASIQTEHSGPLEDAAPTMVKWIPKHWYQKPKPVRKKRKPIKQNVKKVKQVNIEKAVEWSDEMLNEAQRSEPEFQWIIKVKEEHQERPAWESVSLHGEGDKHHWSMWDQLEFKNGILCQRYESEDGKSMKLKPLLPSMFREELFHQLHSARTAAHLGYSKLGFIGRI
jgi:hypothetical protein